MRFVEARDLDSTRPGGVGAALALDARSGERGWLVVAALVGAATGAFVVLSASAAVVVWAALWTAATVAGRVRTRQVGGDDAVLRRVLPLRRRDVVTARYLDSATLVAFYLGFGVVGALLARAFGPPPEDALFSVWVGLLMLAASLPAGLAVAHTHGPVLFFLVVFGAGLGVLLAVLAVWSAVFGEGYDLRAPGEFVAAIGTLVVVAVFASWSSHRYAVRAYERKDL